VVKEDGRQRLNDLAGGYIVGTDAGADFSQMASVLRARPEWLAFDDERARCVANRDAPPGLVGEAIGWACQHATSLNCSTLQLPDLCANSTYRLGDIVFSRFFEELGDAANPLVDCSFNGAALVASSQVYGSWSSATECLAVGSAAGHFAAALSLQESPATSPENKSTHTSTKTNLRGSSGER